MRPPSERVWFRRRRLASAGAWVVAAALFVAPEARAAKPPRTFSTTALADVEAMRLLLLERVARIEVEVRPKPGDPLNPEGHDGYALVLDKGHLVALCFLVEDAQRITIEGRDGKTATGRVVLYDVERRVAIIEAAVPLDTLGLSPGEVAAKSTLKAGDDVFALTAAGPSAGIVNGVLTYVGEEEEYGGHHRTDLVLAAGMPVFDNRARFVGFSRTVAWDRDRMMLVTPEMIREARTATAAKASAPEKDAKASDQTDAKRNGAKPWWSR